MSFYLIGPWTRASRMTPLPQTRLAMTLGAVSALFWLVLLLAAAALARRNVRVNRADRKSAARLAIGYMMLQAAGWVVGNHHVSTVTLETNSFFKMLATAAFNGGGLWVMYLAIEPYGRRLWPDGLLGWTRLFSGHVRDPARRTRHADRRRARRCAPDGRSLSSDANAPRCRMAAPALGFSIN